MVRAGVGALVALGVLLYPPAPAGAQDVVLEGAADVALDRRLTRLLHAQPLVVSQDMAIATGDTIRGSVLVLDATLIHEGVILGDLVLVDAGAFVRPGAVVRGDLVNIGGGLYRSEIAVVGGVILDLPTARYRVIREPDRIVIRADAAPSPFVLDGLYGLHLPTYDRVNGLTLIVGAGYRFPLVAGVQSRLGGQVGWQTERGDPTYALTFTGRRGATTLDAGHQRAWDTRERWIRGDFLNSLVYLWNGQDLRDYHEVDRSWVGLAREFADPARRVSATVGVRGQVEDATSLRGGQPWFILGSETRPNPAIDDGRTTSVVASAELAWEGAQTLFQGAAEYEAAGPWAGGDHRFHRVTTSGRWAMAALANHSLSVDYYLQAPVTSNAMPMQRWTFVGGPATLNTVSTAAFRGDHAVFVDTRYIIPMPDRLALPILGSPRIHLLHAAGLAWTGEAPRRIHQEAGVLLDFFGLFIRFAVVPDDLSVRDLSVGLSSPIGRRFHWER